MIEERPHEEEPYWHNRNEANDGVNHAKPRPRTPGWSLMSHAMPYVRSDYYEVSGED